MAITFPGTTATTAATANGTSATINLPSGITAGEVILIAYVSSESGRSLVASGWTDVSFAATAGDDIAVGLIYKTATGSEGVTQAFTYTSGGSASVSAVARRCAGADTADLFSGSNHGGGQTASIDPFTLAANTRTGLEAESLVLLVFGAQAVRTIVSSDADLTLIGSAAGTAPVTHFLYEAAPGTGNAAYSIDMSGTREYGWALYELKSASASLTHYTITAEPGAVAVTGTAAVLGAARRLAADAGSVAVTGTAASLERGYEIAADAGSVAITGTDATLTYTPNSNEYTLTADPGAFSVSGTDASLKVVRLLSASGGTTGVTGTATSLLRGYRITADAGAYSLTGTAASLLVARYISAGGAAYLVTGTDATLQWSGEVEASALTGSLTLSPSLAGTVALAPSLNGAVAVSPSLTGSLTTEPL